MLLLRGVPGSGAQRGAKRPEGCLHRQQGPMGAIATRMTADEYYVSVEATASNSLTASSS